jgi:hypothetical protein
MENLIRKHHLLLIGLTLVSVIYALTLQTIPNGSGHPYMIDVGETQIALNVWGTLHATGYPLYTLLGNLLSPLPQVVGVNPAAAASLTSWVWAFAAYALLYRLLCMWTGRPEIAALAVVWLALTRSLWIHSVIAEVYSLSLLILLGLWWIALHPTWSLRQRFYGLALLGGLGIAHHRAIAFAGLGLLYALWPALRQEWRSLPRWIGPAGLLFLLGFLPYLYLPIRANAQAEWVYAEDVNTWDGFWFNFWGREADYLVQRPTDWAGWQENLLGTATILGREVTWPGLALGLLALLVALRYSPQQRQVWTVCLSALGFLAFAVSYHQAVLPEAILMMTLPSLAVGMALSLVWLASQKSSLLRAGQVLGVLWIAALIAAHYDFIHSLTHNRAAFESIEAASAVPRSPLEQSALMLSWGPRYFAASYSRLVTRQNADLLMVDHTADFAALSADGVTFYTEPATLYGYPPSWWEARLGHLYLTGAHWNLIRLGTAPRLVEPIPQERLQAFFTEGIWLAGSQVTCDADYLYVALSWYAQAAPQEDYSVKVHLVRPDRPGVLAQADSSAPVMGWRPTSTWQAHELLGDYYRLPTWEGGQIVLGLYQQGSAGQFINYGDFRLAIPDECSP